MELVILVVVFCMLAIGVLVATYMGGTLFGLIGVVILALYTTWIRNLLRNFGHPNGGSSEWIGLKTASRKFLKYLFIASFVFFGVNHGITWIKTGVYDPMQFFTWLILMCSAGVYVYKHS